RDAEAVAAALDDAFAGRRPYDDAMADYQRARDEEVEPMYEFTCDFAKIEPPPLEMQQLIGAMRGNQERWTASSASWRARCRPPSSSDLRTPGESWPRRPHVAEAVPQLDRR
ncbi:MAG: hypothetical protein ACRDN8_07855, partial [Thermoleophilaceae bacterium]